MTQEEKAKRYDDLLMKLQKAKVDNNVCDERYCCVIDDIVPELKESEDRIRKALIKFHKSTIDIDGIKGEDILAWLEKQGEKGTNGNERKILNSEQKPADKIEPKFHKGDWVTDGHLHCKISDILDDRYIVDSKFAKKSAILFKDRERWHLWTINDAKDGDVLAVENMIFIYKTVLASHIVSYCKLFNNKFEFFNDARTCCEGNSKVHPATKEQRVLLFQKIHEAGYEWDAEKKELKKIEQKPAWSEEDEEEFQIAIDTLVKAGQHDSADWLKSLKNRVQPQQKQEWCEDDGHINQWIISDIEKLLALKKKSSIIAGKEIKWLKSLRSQKHWKPTGAQLASLEIACDRNDRVGFDLTQLLKELKKVREE